MPRPFGYKITEETRQKLILANSGTNNPRYGKKWSEETRLKMKKRIPWNKGMKGKQIWHDITGLSLGHGWCKDKKCPWTTKRNLENNPSKKGELHWKWKKDRSTLAKRQQRNDSAYFEWHKQVWLRDNFKCKIANPNCKGRIEAHHILSWRDYPELRYEVNNGITLCHAHHPRKRSDETELSPYFQELVAQKQ